jgi:glycosyltransferase involved in cell wall biosynthesis
MMKSQSYWDVEILTDIDNREATTGEKRNRLIERARGKYIVFFDDDDIATPEYLPLILKAIESDPDVIPINGWITTNKLNPIYWDMGLSFGYGTKTVNGIMVYERFPNHIAPMKRELILPYKFKDITIGEDYEWAKRLNDDKVFKTECRITTPIYHYKYLENK